MPDTRFPIGRTAAAAATIVLLTFCRDVPQPTEPAAPTPRAAPRPFAATPLLTGTPAYLIGAGDIGTCSSDSDEGTATLLDSLPGTVMALGDNAYVNGTTTEYADCYEPTWGRHKARTRPAAGERDYAQSGAAAYFAYFGAAAGDPAKGYYSYELGGWHVIVLNSNLPMNTINAQYKWLKADLAASATQCTVAYWHLPRFYSSGSTGGVHSSVKPAWDLLYAYGAELVVNADSRYYERFAPQTPLGEADPAYGIRQITAGTGGAARSVYSTIRENSEVRNNDTPGVVRLALGTGEYAWEFVPIAGKTFTDAGTTACHGAPLAIAVAGGPYMGEALITFDGSASSDPQGDKLTTYEWDFGDGSTGTGVAASHTYVADGQYTATLIVVDALGNRSVPSHAAVTIADYAPVVSAGPSQQVVPVGLPSSMAVSFTDLGVEDNPWAWTIAWGDGTTDAGTTQTQGVSFTVNHAFPGLGSYTAILSVTDKDGATGSDTTTITIASPELGTVILAAGDISSCSQERDELTARILDTIPGTVFTLGDNVYPEAQRADYVNCFEPTWGRHKGRLFAVLGNHEYTVDAAASFDYFGDRAGPRGLGYYSYNVGNWHIVVINDNLPIGTGSAQDVWLKADLAANPKACTLAMFHQPRFMSADDSYTLRDSRKTIWNRLYAAGAELVLNGHQHFYERFLPMRPDGTRDDATGIQQVIVGVGGENSKTPTVNIWPTSVVRSDHFGVMKLTLHPGRWDWQFVPAKGYTFTDSGSGTCH